MIFRQCNVVDKDQLLHFSHHHPLSLVHLRQPNHKVEDADDEYEDEDENEDEQDFVEEDHHCGQCSMCNEQIWPFHLCYYYCKSCDYSLHTFCFELPMTQQNHPLHPDHNLTLSKVYQNSGSQYYQSTDFKWRCNVCNLEWNNVYNYHCSMCNFNMDIICATLSKHNINHPSHPHQLERMFGPKVSSCSACGNKHEGVFFQCTACLMFLLHLNCVLMPAKLLIQNHTNGSFVHKHPLTLAYSFSYSDKRSKYYPLCRVCDEEFCSHLWIYKCDKCRYYVHVDCATSKREPFMSIFQTASLAKTFKNYKEDEHPNLLCCPLYDEGDHLIKRHMSNRKEFNVSKQHNGEILNHSSHQHPLILYDKETSSDQKSVPLHDPMKRIQLLCNGCVRPIMTPPFYMCCQYVDEQCCFVLHEWCAKIPLEVNNYMGHPEHDLYLLEQVDCFFNVFLCGICLLPSNGFAYACTICEFIVDVNCAFIPEEITHDAHQGHILSKVYHSAKLSERYCNACEHSMDRKLGFTCPSCEFYIHVDCALLLPSVIKHKFDKHPLSLRYEPVENHISEYFCEICENEFSPWEWFYHCTTCEQSMHAACAPLILQCEQATYGTYGKSVYWFLNIKFGRMLEIEGHSHQLAFVQGIESDGKCSKCGEQLQCKMTFKCLECDYAIHFHCACN